MVDLKDVFADCYKRHLMSRLSTVQSYGWGDLSKFIHINFGNKNKTSAIASGPSLRR